MEGMTSTTVMRSSTPPFHTRPRRRIPSSRSFSFRKFLVSSSADEDGRRGTSPQLKSPAEEFAPLAAVFRRRSLVGIGTASVVALGANFAGVTSLLLGFDRDFGRKLKLDALYPIDGYRRCIETTNGFEFIYPAEWVGDQTLLYRTIGREESKRQLDPPPLDRKSPESRRFSEPVVAFGPPGSNGELNVSVIVSPVSPSFSIEAFGGTKDVGEAVVRTVAARGPKIEATLIESRLREDTTTRDDVLNNKHFYYYELEFLIKSPSFRRHNVAVCCACGGRLFTLNAQAPESMWPEVKEEFYSIADSFNVSI